jgi:hypothetical protein
MPVGIGAVEKWQESAESQGGGFSSLRGPKKAGGASKYQEEVIRMEP